MTYMVLVLFLSCVVAAKVYEPEDLQCYCVGSEDPMVVSFDGSAKMITSPGKTLISRWDDARSDVCKFQLRVVTKDGISGLRPALHVDWAGFSFGVHPKNDKKYKNNFLFANDVNGTGKVAMRGHNKKPMQVIDFASAPTFAYSPPGHDNCTWSVSKAGDHLFQLRSDCCPYAFNWLPYGDGSAWQLYVGDGRKYADGTMRGTCGDCDGDVINDWTECFRGVVLPMSVSSVATISHSCLEGKHAGALPEGGAKLGP